MRTSNSHLSIWNSTRHVRNLACAVMLVGVSLRELFAQTDAGPEKKDSTTNQSSISLARIELFSQTDHPYLLKAGQFQFIVIPYAVFEDRFESSYIENFIFKVYGGFQRRIGLSNRVEISTGIITAEEWEYGPYNDSRSIEDLSLRLKVRAGKNRSDNFELAFSPYIQLPDPVEIELINFGLEIPFSFEFSKSSLGFMPRIDIESYQLFGEYQYTETYGGLSAIYRVQFAPTLAGFFEGSASAELEQLDDIGGYLSSGFTFGFGRYIQIGGSVLLGVFGRPMTLVHSLE